MPMVWKFAAKRRMSAMQSGWSEFLSARSAWSVLIEPDLSSSPPGLVFGVLADTQGPCIFVRIWAWAGRRRRFVEAGRANAMVDPFGRSAALLRIADFE